MANFNQNLVFNGLGSISFTIPIAGQYFFEGNISLPSIVGGSGPSSVVVVVNQNGSPVYTGVAGATGFRCDVLCAFDDVMQIVFSSAAAPDQVLNSVKSTISYGIGV
jgi:hypothetical protein